MRGNTKAERSTWKHMRGNVSVETPQELTDRLWNREAVLLQRFHERKLLERGEAGEVEPVETRPVLEVVALRLHRPDKVETIILKR